MEIVYIEPNPVENPMLPLYQLTVNLTGNVDGADHWAIDEQSQGLPREVAVSVLLQLAASHLNDLCQQLGQSGRGPGLLVALAQQVEHHYQAHHHLCAGTEHVNDPEVL